MSIILKVDCDGDIRRATLGASPSFSEVDEAIRGIWPGRGADGAKYKDDEGDSCTLKEQTFSDFLATSQQGAAGSVLRLQLPCEAVDNSVNSLKLQATGGYAAETQPRASAEAVQSADESPTERCRVMSMATPPGSPRDEHPASSSSQAACSPAPDEILLDNSPGPGGFLPRTEILVAESIPLEGEDDASPCSPAADGVVIDHDVHEKIDIILAAFDANGDGYLNFSESSALHKAATGQALDEEVFQKQCKDEGEDLEVGLGWESLMCVYSRCSTLERDFEAAKAKLEALTSEERAQRPLPPDSAENSFGSLILKNPLLAVPFALDATERLRQGVFGGRRRAQS